MENQNKVANSLSLGSKFTDGDGIERHYLERNFFDWIELHELKDVGLIENSIDQFLPHLDNTGYYQVSRNSTKNLTKEPHQYGELIILGFRCYQISSSQELIPVGTSNDRFQLRSKHFQTEKSNHSSIIFQPNMILANKNYYPMIGNEMEIVHCVTPYNISSVDIFQIGRSESSANDLIVRGISGEYDGAQGRNGRASVSRYSCRIVCSKTSPHSCRIFSGGFDEKQEIKLPIHSPQWKEEDGTIDGLPTTAIQIWHPIYKQWAEVSIMGKVFAPRKSYIISEQNKFVPGERLPLTNELLDGSIIDLGGCLLLFKSSVNESVSIENGTSEELNMVKTMNAHRPHCPVLFQPLQFSTISLQEKQHRMWNYVKSAHHLPNFSRNSTAPEFFLDDLNPQHSTPYVFSSCGHVYGYSKQLEGRSCPLCRKIGPYVPLVLSSYNYFSSKNPSHVFNPCGHVSSFEICQLWSQIPLPDLIKSPDRKYFPCCPFCLMSVFSTELNNHFNRKLDSSTPFSKLIIMFDERLEDG